MSLVTTLLLTTLAADGGAIVQSLDRAARNRALEVSASAAVGAPHPMNLSLDLTFGARLAVGFSWGMLDTKIHDVRLHTDNLEGRLRWFPLAGGFVSLGAAMGAHSVHAETEITVEIEDPVLGIPLGEETVTVTFDLRSLYAAPFIGFQWRLGPGLLLGADLGWLFPVSPRTRWDVDSDSGLVDLGIDLADDLGAFDGIDRMVDRVGRQSIPYVVLRVGWSP